MATHLFRIAQSAALQAVKPGRAQHVNIGLAFAADEIVLSITDDGPGQREDRQGGGPDEGGGVRAMAYRADLIGATFTIERLGERGARVSCALPALGLQNDRLKIKILLVDDHPLVREGVANLIRQQPDMGSVRRGGDRAAGFADDWPSRNRRWRWLTSRWKLVPGWN